MSDKMRWRYGDTNPVIAAVDSDTVIEIGDLLWQDTDDAKPAESVCDVANFLGVAMQRSRAGDTGPVRVATTGVFEFDCLINTFELGDCLCIRGRQLVDKLPFVEYGIGRVARREATPSPIVLVDIHSTVMNGQL